MKQQKLDEYNPKYPKKVIKGAALAATALVALGTAAGCRMIRPETTGIVPMEDPGILETVPPEELQTEGMVPIDETETPEPEEIMLSGDVLVGDFD